jgi:DNA-binding transcriptional MocR family regulator
VPSYRTHGAVPHWFVRDAVPAFELKLSHIAVFVVICDQIDAQGRSKISQRTMMERTGASRSTVQGALGDLLRLHLVEQTWHASVKTAAQYEIPESMPWPPSKIPAPTMRDEAQMRQRRRA